MTCSLCPITVKKSLAKVLVWRKPALGKFDAETTITVALVTATTEAGYLSTIRKRPWLRAI
jgi:hypothetical protein